MYKYIKQISANSIIYAAGDFLVKGFAFLLIPLYTRYLTVDDYGIISVVGVTSSVLQIFYMVGLGSAAVRFYYDYQNIEDIKIYYFNVLMFVSVIPLFFSFLLTFVGSFVSPALFKEIPFYPYFLMAIWLAYLSLIPEMLRSLWIASKKAVSFIFFSTIRFLITTGMVIFFVVFLRGGAAGKIGGQLVGTLMMWLTSMIILGRFVIFRLNRKNIKESLLFGFPLIFHHLAKFTLDLSDRYMLQYLTNVKEVGLYSLGYQFGSLVHFVAVPISMSFGPFFFQLADKDESTILFPRLASMFCLVVFWIGLTVSLFAREIVYLMSTPKYYDAYKVISLVTLGSVFISLYYFPIKGLGYKKRTKVIPLATGFSGAINIVLNIILIPKYGMMGAAWATVVGYFSQFVIIFLLSQRAYFINYEYGKILKVIAVAITFFVVGNHIPIDSAWLVTTIKGLLLICFVPVLCLLGFFEKTELEKIKMVFSNIRKSK